MKMKKGLNNILLKLEKATNWILQHQQYDFSKKEKK